MLNDTTIINNIKDAADGIEVYKNAMKDFLPQEFEDIFKDPSAVGAFIDERLEYLMTSAEKQLENPIFVNAQDEERDGNPLYVYWENVNAIIGVRWMNINYTGTPKVRVLIYAKFADS